MFRDDELVRIAEFPSPSEATIAKAILDGEGIDSVVTNVTMSYGVVYPSVLDRIGLQVRLEDVDRALHLLKGLSEQEPRAFHEARERVACDRNAGAVFAELQEVMRSLGKIKSIDVPARKVEAKMGRLLIKFDVTVEVVSAESGCEIVMQARGGDSGGYYARNCLERIMNGLGVSADDPEDQYWNVETAEEL